LLGADDAADNTRSPIAIARGTVKVNVPKSKSLMLKLSKEAIYNPKCLNEISAAGIDSLKVSYLPMDDSDDELCNRALQYLPHFGDLQSLDVDRSNVSDAGLSKIRSLTKLKAISAFTTAVKGNCFKEFRYLPELTSLTFDYCPIDQTNLAYLTALPHLKFLSLGKSDISDTNLKVLSACASLTKLKICGNPKITDRGLKYLLSMKHLTDIDLRETSVTMSGIEQLRSLPLRSLTLDGKLVGASENAKLTKLFPNTAVKIYEQKPSAETQMLFGRLH